MRINYIRYIQKIIERGQSQRPDIFFYIFGVSFTHNIRKKMSTQTDEKKRYPITITYIIRFALRAAQSTIDSEGFKGGTRGSPIMPRDAVSRTANVESTGRHKWVKIVAYKTNRFRTLQIFWDQKLNSTTFGAAVRISREIPQKQQSASASAAIQNPQCMNFELSEYFT